MNRPLYNTAKSAMTFYRIATSSLRLMPDFIIIGAERGGTTSLYNYLVEHPNIASAAKKEVHFFDDNFPKGVSWYRGQFPYAAHRYYAENVRKRDLITGEGSPYYLFHPHAAKRVKQVAPHAKLIVVLRNPVERAYSHYCWEVGWGNEKLTFEEAIACEEERTKKEGDKIAANEHYISYNHLHFTYLAKGIYVDQLQHWMSLFPKEQFLLLQSEEFYADPAASFKQTLEFLNVPKAEPKALQKEYKQYNKPKNIAPSSMNPETRKQLVEYFEPHNARLYKFLGKDFGWK
jgi:hypothetical protein